MGVIERPIFRGGNLGGQRQNNTGMINQGQSNEACYPSHFHVVIILQVLLYN